MNPADRLASLGLPSELLAALAEVMFLPRHPSFLFKHFVDGYGRTPNAGIARVPLHPGVDGYCTAAA